MIAQWDISLSVLPVARVQFPAMVEYFKGYFPGWPHSANPSWASVAENGSISPRWHCKTCGQRGGRPKSNHGQMMAYSKKEYLNLRVFDFFCGYCGICSIRHSICREEHVFRIDVSVASCCRARLLCSELSICPHSGGYNGFNGNHCESYSPFASHYFDLPECGIR